MSKFEFTATHGVHLADIGAHFQRDHDAEGVVYRFETDDAKQADALGKVEGYGITCVRQPEKLTAAEKKAAKEAADAEAKAAAEAAAADQS
jgi:hypothetical protein